MFEIEAVRMEFPADANIIVGQSHFIKTVEDLYEAVGTTVPQAKFGLAFNESSGACLTRADGNEEGLRDAAIRNARTLGCGHVFVLLIQNAYPINVLNASPRCARYSALPLTQLKSLSPKVSKVGACSVSLMAARRKG